MSDQLTIPTVEPPREIIVDGNELLSKVKEIEAKGGKVTMMERGKTQSEWILRVRWE